MTPRLVALAAAALCVAAAGCGFGPGDSSQGDATLTVTRDYGSELIVEATESEPPASETVIRFLDREAEITTRYGGGFVQSIEGLGGAVTGRRSFDWFFFVDGVESSVGSAEREVRGGHRIWWDYRDWTDAMRVPAVVGSWPEPFLQTSVGADRIPVRIECAGSRPPCEDAAERFAEEGIEASIEPLATADQPGAEAFRLLVGPWAAIEDDPAAAMLDDGPSTSGVFARFSDSARSGLVALDEEGRSTRRLGATAGLVAAVRDREQPPTWLVTGATPRGVDAAVTALEEADLKHRYAIAVDRGEALGLPVLGEDVE
jgi:hypothetical protein